MRAGRPEPLRSLGREHLAKAIPDPLIPELHPGQRTVEEAGAGRELGLEQRVGGEELRRCHEPVAGDGEEAESHDREEGLPAARHPRKAAVWPAVQDQSSMRFKGL